MPTSNDIYNLIVSGSQSINTELTSFTPSSQVIFYEFDMSEISPTIKNYNVPNQPISNKDGVFRIYNDYNLYKIINNPYGAVKWQNNFYYPFPIYAEGFEYTSNGTLPTPKIIISNLSPDLSNNSFYRYIRMQIQSLGDIVGAKFSRIRTFLKYLDGSNFSGGYNPFNPITGLYEVELPRDIYYIDRKSVENRDVIEYQLNTILDLENLTLPSRTLFAKQCPFQYRGEGCVYEYDKRLTYIHSGVYANTVNNSISIQGLQTAPPTATENDQLFIGSIFPTGGRANIFDPVFRITGGLGDSGVWTNSAQYYSGDFVFLENKGLKFYYVCINNHTSDLFNAPPNINYWTSDSCSKSLNGCRLRWLKNPAFKPIIWPTNRNGETYQQTLLRLGFNGIYASGELSLWVTGMDTNRDGINEPVFFPRRPGAEDPSSPRAHGIPKDKNGNYLNGFLPFGGFPGTNQPQQQ